MPLAKARIRLAKQSGIRPSGKDVQAELKADVPEQEFSRRNSAKTLPDWLLKPDGKNEPADVMTGSVVEFQV